MAQTVATAKIATVTASPRPGWPRGAVAYPRDLEHRPRLWMGWEKDLPPGEKLVACFRPFILHLASSGFSRKTIRRYVDHLWLLGGEIIRELNQSLLRNGRPRIVFFHLPRTGGTALVKDILFPNFPRSRWCHVNYSPDLKPLNGAHDPLAWTESKRGRVLLLAGHMPFGLDRQFPGPSEYVTLLRHPITRTVSDYYFCRRNPSNPAHAAARRLSLIEFVEGGYGMSHNCYVRWLSKAAYGTEFRTDDEMLKSAQTNLAEFSLVGLTELFEVSVRRICDRYGLTLYPPSKINRNDATPHGGDISTEERRVLSRYNALDMVIYEDCRKQFLTQDSACLPG